MNLATIKNLLEKEEIPSEIKNQVIDSSFKAITDDKEVEVIVEARYIYVDVYDDSGVLVDRARFTYKRFVVPFEQPLNLDF